ncbi:peroxidase 2-like isoform X1 [Hordeum vulgare subsp. vulgare]|uniref:Peroxidase n=1 Tax=Hordeum vulgare subsp. vulgare TaxID=112509 RepID=A0A8I6XCP6_HORVV|nr:peroxidase 2-like isoform X1 [Hordeum vulgare subsp. vulgare]
MASPSLSVVLLLCLAAAASAVLSPPTFYNTSCTQALAIIKTGVAAAIATDRSMGASLLRLHFHDCFVQGCDASVLLDATVPNSERSALGNAGSLRGFDVIEKIKADVEAACKKKGNSRAVVSCADILAVAARDSVVALGGPAWDVQLGRRDSDTANVALANQDLPPPFMDVAGLIKSFGDKGFTMTDMVALSGAHTIGRAQCKNFRSRLYGEDNIDSDYATKLRANCPQTSGDGNLAQLDDTPTTMTADNFDNSYFVNLQLKKGLLHSDQVLFNGTGGTNNTVNNFASNPPAFSSAFASAMVTMGNLSPLTGSQGQIRRICSKPN